MLSINFNLFVKSQIRYFHRSVLLFVFLLFFLDTYDVVLSSGYAFYLKPALLPDLNLYTSFPIFASILLFSQLAKFIGFIAYSFLINKYSKKLQATNLYLIGICFFCIAIFPSYSICGYYSLSIFFILKIILGMTLGYEIGFVVNFANNRLSIANGRHSFYYFILMAGEIGIVVSLFLNRWFISHNINMLDYEYVWRTQAFMASLIVYICICIKRQYGIFDPLTTFKRRRFIIIFSKHWRYILLRSFNVFYLAMLVLVVLVRAPNVLELVFNWHLTEINHAVLIMTISAFLGANFIFLLCKFFKIDPFKLMVSFYILNLIIDIIVLITNDYSDPEFYRWWFYIMAFFYGAFLRLTPTVIYKIEDFDPSNRLIGRYISHAIAYMIFVSIAIFIMDYSHFLVHTLHDAIPILVITFGVIVALWSLLKFKKYI